MTDSDEVVIEVKLPPEAKSKTVVIPDYTGKTFLIEGENPDGSINNLTYELTRLPENGQLFGISGPVPYVLSDNSITYEPFADPVNDYFEFRVKDVYGFYSDDARVDLVPLNDPPNTFPFLAEGPTSTSEFAYPDGYRATTTFTLSGEETSDDNDDPLTELSYEWTLESGPISLIPADFVNPSTSKSIVPSFSISRVDQPVHGEYVFRLTVTDTGLLSTSETVTINVPPPPPLID